MEYIFWVGLNKNQLWGFFNFYCCDVRKNVCNHFCLWVCGRLHHHHVTPSTYIALTFSLHPSLSSIVSGGSSRLHLVSAQSCSMKVRDGSPAFARPCVGVHRSTSLMSSSLLLQQCPACLFPLTLMVFGIGGRCSYRCFFVGCCLQDLFNIARSLLV